MHDDIVELIESAHVAFPKFGKGVAQVAIDRAEKDLGIPLPDSYKWWLLNYGGGQVGSDIVFGLDEFDSGRPDIVELAKLNDRETRDNRREVVFYIGNGEEFFFDTSALNAGEYPILYRETSDQDGLPYAASFADFLRKRIREVCGIRP